LRFLSGPWKVRTTVLSVRGFFVCSNICNLYEFYSFVVNFPDRHITGVSLFDMAVVGIMGQFPIIRPIAAHRSTLLDFRQQVKQFLPDIQRQAWDLFSNLSA
jgi:hypothetical protein